ncbi:MAG: DUF3761 domain-containing protein [Bacteroidetes bacterium]|nr:DUF3761 domain-containing protein [Bacteroidota bacterium]
MISLDSLEKYSKKVESIYKKVISKIDNKRSLNSSKIKPFYKKAINFLIAILILFSFVTLFKGFLEYKEGNHPIYEKVRVGAICYDGWHSYSTGRGTCSHHGGVKEWLYKDIKVGMHYSNQESFFDLSKISFAILLLPALFQRYYGFTLILYSINTISFLVYSIFSIIAFVLTIIITALYFIWKILSSIFTSHNNKN